MAELLTLDSLFTLFMLVLLQAVLGFDNLLYISLESQKAPKEKQSYVRKMGVGLAIILRIILLFLLLQLIDFFQEPFWHMMLMKEHIKSDTVKKKSVKSVIMWIVIMNLVFSFDSILSAMALTSDMDKTPQLILMTVAVILGGLLMIVMADKVSDFLQKNKMYEVLGLFILFIVGIMLLSEGGHLAHLKLFGNKVEQMSKATFYFVIITLVIIDIVQGRYQKNLLAKKEMIDKAAEEAES